MEFLIYHPVLRSPAAVIEDAPSLEALGFDGLVMPDHLYVLDFQSGVPLAYPHPLPVLAAAAAVTSRVKLLALVSNNLARGPVELAQQTATLANLAPGRVELALGAGWFEAEHVAAGVGFPDGADRRARLVESVSICRRLFAEGTVDHDGEHYRVSVPKGGFVTVDAPIPIMVGADLQPDALRGGGANLADYNSYTFELLAAGAERAMAEAAAAGRSIRVSASPFVLVTPDEAEGAAERQAMADFLGLDAAVLETSFGTLIGSADEVAAKLARYPDAGCDRVHLQTLNGEAAMRIAPLLPALREA
jgi:alkanesulfonate monooxygenase SsuD/methylene tetrahydromethanopterin reductase-like flavin-dependent oxidoreductase (luciferase family)